MKLEQKIKKMALGMGFDVVGITGPKAIEEGERAVEEWVRRGLHGDQGKGRDR